MQDAPPQGTVEGYVGKSPVRYLRTKGGDIRLGNSGGPVFSADPTRPIAVCGYVVASETGHGYVVTWKDVLLAHPEFRAHLTTNADAVEALGRTAEWSAALKAESSILGQADASTRRVREFLAGEARRDGLRLIDELSASDRTKLDRSLTHVHTSGRTLAVEGRFGWFYFWGLVVTEREVLIVHGGFQPEVVVITLKQVQDPAFAIWDRTILKFRGQASSYDDYLFWQGGPKKGLPTGMASRVSRTVTRLRDALHEL